MNKKILKLYAVPIIYIIALFIFGTSMFLIQRIFNNNRFTITEVMEYVDSEIVTDNEYIPVVNTVATLLRPYLNGNVKVNKTFYNYEDETSKQENSLIIYEGTYMQNSGVDYTYSETFDIVSILDGTVIEVNENELLGKTVKIRHNNDLISIYQSLSEVNVNVDELVLRGQIIGKSGTCSIYSKDSNLHFELSYQGHNIDPEKNYEKAEDEL